MEKYNGKSVFGGIAIGRISVYKKGEIGRASCRERV